MRIRRIITGQRGQRRHPVAAPPRPPQRGLGALSLPSADSFRPESFPFQTRGDDQALALHVKKSRRAQGWQIR